MIARFILSITLFIAALSPLTLSAQEWAHHHNPAPHSHLHSEWREKGENYKHAADRYHQRLESAAHISGTFKNRKLAGLWSTSAEDAAGPVSQVNLDIIPEWPQASSVQQVFENARDLRFLPDFDHADPKTGGAFRRRDTWLYPDDGCFARAALMGKNIQAMGYSRPAKLFIFGDLEVKSPNTLKGYATWWYHVVNAIKVDGKIIVLDPSVSALGPMDLDSWIAAMSTDPASVQISACSPKTYTPESSCDHPDEAEFTAQSDQDAFLDREWERQLELGRDPRSVLGDNPPWMTTKTMTKSMTN